MIHPLSTYNHILENWVYASAAARTGATGFLAGDVGKIAYQSDLGQYWRLTATTPTWALVDKGGQYNASVASVSAGYAADTYLAGSSVLADAGAWKAKAIYHCIFDMVKTAAGVAAFTVNVRMGTLGTTGDASVLSLAFAVGTAVADTGLFALDLVFRTVGSGTTAVVQGLLSCWHHLAATGLITTGASGFGLIIGTSAGFASTTQTILGLSVNGGAAFSGTNTLVAADIFGNN
jgi:hypothetical protein